ncbi:hypothetical protein MXD61_06815 [Frankia sp. AgPm24]|uniref:hypothetical protein n=1 Tax=Frankia sp. AgPm24 TaxID=631128 RepID=UPI00200CB3FE|nr:hypothetical protein [Frankia sp. AgPm24]MCK9921602.1 hypothetical protein [Frankia sp. AgPm24]
MDITVLVMTDGRDDLLDRTLQSAQWSLGGPITRWMIHDDTGDAQHREALKARYPQAGVISASNRRAGFGGSLRWAWIVITLLAKADEECFVFHLEDDFVFRHPVDLRAMADVLTAHPHLAQLALRRQPWNPAERAAGGIVEQHPDDYTEVRDGEHAWLEHRQFFTTNPCLYRRELCTAGWPTGPESEGRFGLGLLDTGLPWGVPGDEVRFGFWGGRDSGEQVEHIGTARVGTGY